MKNKFIKKYVTRVLFLCFAVIFLINIISCGKIPEDAVLKYISPEGKIESYMSKNLYSLWMSLQKSMYSYLASDESAWDKVYTTENESFTLSELISNQAIDSAKNLVAGAYLFDKVYNLKLDEQQKDFISDQINSFMSQLGISGKDKLNEYLSSYGANENTLREYFTLVAKYDILYNYLSSQSGIIGVSDEEKMEYFGERYVIVTQIFLNTGYKTKADGTNIALTQEEIQSQQALAEEILNKLKAGEDFSALREEYSEDIYGETLYPYGFFVTNDGTFPIEFENAAFEMFDNEIRKIETVSGESQVGINIIKKIPMNKFQYNIYPDIEKKISENIISEKFKDFMNEYTQQVQVNEEIAGLFDFRRIPAFS